MSREIETFFGRLYVASMSRAGTIQGRANDGSLVQLVATTGPAQVTFQAISDSVIVSDDDCVILPGKDQQGGKGDCLIGFGGIEQNYNPQSTRAQSGTAVAQAIAGSADSAALNAHMGNAAIHITADERNKWNAGPSAQQMETAARNAITAAVGNAACEGGHIELEGGLTAPGTINALQGVHIGNSPLTSASALTPTLAKAAALFEFAAVVQQVEASFKADTTLEDVATETYGHNGELYTGGAEYKTPGWWTSTPCRELCLNSQQVDGAGVVVYTRGYPNIFYPQADKSLTAQRYGIGRGAANLLVGHFPASPLNDERILTGCTGCHWFPLDLTDYRYPYHSAINNAGGYVGPNVLIYNHNFQDVTLIRVDSGEDEYQWYLVQATATCPTIFSQREGDNVRTAICAHNHTLTSFDSQVASNQSHAQFATFSADGSDTAVGPSFETHFSSPLVSMRDVMDILCSGEAQTVEVTASETNIPASGGSTIISISKPAGALQACYCADSAAVTPQSNWSAWKSGYEITISENTTGALREIWVFAGCFGKRATIVKLYQAAE